MAKEDDIIILDAVWKIHPKIDNKEWQDIARTIPRVLPELTGMDKMGLSSAKLEAFNFSRKNLNKILENTKLPGGKRLVTPAEMISYLRTVRNELENDPELEGLYSPVEKSVYKALQMNADANWRAEKHYYAQAKAQAREFDKDKKEKERSKRQEEKAELNKERQLSSMESSVKAKQREEYLKQKQIDAAWAAHNRPAKVKSAEAIWAMRDREEAKQAKALAKATASEQALLRTNTLSDVDNMFTTAYSRLNPLSAGEERDRLVGNILFDINRKVSTIAKTNILSEKDLQKIDKRIRKLRADFGGMTPADGGAPSPTNTNSGLLGKIVRGAGVLEILRNTIGMFSGDAFSSMKSGRTVAGLVAGASTGAALGSIIPGIGNVVGAIGGGVVGGLFGNLSGNVAAKRMTYAQQQMVYGSRYSVPFTQAYEQYGLGSSAVAFQNQGNYFGARTMLGMTSKNEWLGLALLSNYSKAMMSGAGPSERAAALRRDKSRLSTTPGLWNMAVQMAGIPEDIVATPGTIGSQVSGLARSYTGTGFASLESAGGKSMLGSFFGNRVESIITNGVTETKKTNKILENIDSKLEGIKGGNTGKLSGSTVSSKEAE